MQKRLTSNSESPSVGISLTGLLYIASLIVSITSFGPPVLTMVIPRSDPSSLSVGEWIDLLTPFLVIWIIGMIFLRILRLKLHSEFQFSDAVPLGLALFFGTLMTAGQAMHLSANAISHFLNQETHGDIWSLNYLFDEVISHYMWHIGAWGLAMSAALFQLKYPVSETSRVFVLLPAAVLLAFTFTFATIEGHTILAILPLTFAAIVGFLSTVRARRISLSSRPVLVYFLLVCGLMLLGWLGYGYAFRGFPEISSLASFR